MNLKVVGQNIIVVIGEEKLSKRIEDKTAREAFVKIIKSNLDILNSKSSDNKKQIVKEQTIALFTKNTEINKAKSKVANKNAKSKEVAEIIEIKESKNNLKERKKSVSTVVSNRITNRKEEENKINDSIEKAKADLQKANEEKNKTTQVSRSSRESGYRW